jgi:nucleotide sugar dehydrogenase
VKKSILINRLERFSKLDKLQACVVGLGRIGLPISAKLARSGVKTYGFDINSEVIAMINNGNSLMDEPGVTNLVLRVMKAGKLVITNDINVAMKDVDVVIICAPTPINESKKPDYSAIKLCCNMLSPHLRKGMLVIVESTVGIGAVEHIIAPILETGSKLKAGFEGFLLASCPERADPGKILRNFATVPRIIGGIDKQSTEAAAIFYRAVFNVPIVKVRNARTANAVKLIENIFRDMNIALVNELAVFLSDSDVDLVEAINAAKTKWNFVAHYPSVGVGGPCLPVNAYYLLNEWSDKNKSLPRIVKIAREINDKMPNYIVSMILDSLHKLKSAKNVKIAILGITYKPNIKCVQYSPSEIILKELRARTELLKCGAEISVYDPLFKGETFFGFKIQDTLEETIKNANCLVILTAHDEFRKKRFGKTLKLLDSRAIIIDGANVLEPSEVMRMNFKYRSLRRGNSPISA